MIRCCAWQVAAAAIIAAVPALAAPAQDKPFTVANYPVDAKAKNAVAAKDKAISDGQQSAFRSLLKRIVPVTAYNRVDKLKDVKANEYLEGFAVRSEQNSGTDYIATLDFSFQANEVRDLLQREGVPFVDTQAQRTLLIPVLRAPGPAPSSATGPAVRVPLLPATGAWNSVWSGLDLDNTLTPLKVEGLKTSIDPASVSAMLSGDASAFQKLAAEYKSDTIIVAAAEADTAGRRLVVTVSGVDATGPINWTRTYKLSDGDMDYTMELAAVVTLGVLEGRWKATQSDGGLSTVATPGAGADIAMQVEFETNDEWDDIRGRVLELPGIDDVRVGTVSSRSAEMSLKYPGGPGLLANELAPRGLTLRNTAEGWRLRTSN